MEFVATTAGEEARVRLVEDGEPEPCEHCGSEVRTYFIGAVDETWQMAECLPCALKASDSIRRVLPSDRADRFRWTEEDVER